MKENDAILKRQDYKVKFNNKDMDFCFNWMLGIGQMLGMSAGELFYIASGIRDGNPADWRERFTEHANYLENEAEQAEKDGYRDLMSHLYFQLAMPFVQLFSLQIPMCRNLWKIFNAWKIFSC